jgi:hypothetical protein
MQWTANSVAQIAIGFANSNAICSTPFAAIDAGVRVHHHEEIGLNYEFTFYVQLR